MARTRGITATGIQSLDGEFVGAPRRKLSNADVVVAEPQPPPPPPPPITRYICNDITMVRDMDAWELMQLLKLAMGVALEISVPADEFRGLSPNLRRHFRGVAGGE